METTSKSYGYFSFQISESKHVSRHSVLFKATEQILWNSEKSKNRGKLPETFSAKIAKKQDVFFTQESSLEHRRVVGAIAKRGSPLSLCWGHRVRGITAIKFSVVPTPGSWLPSCDQEVCGPWQNIFGCGHLVAITGRGITADNFSVVVAPV